VESFEVEMLRAEAEQHRKEAEAARREKEALAVKLETVRAEFEQRIAKLEKEKEEERASQNEEKRLKLEQELQELRHKTATKLAEFDSLKTSLLRDLQNRCEKVIDLEMLLDEAREQYEQLLKSSSNKSLQKKNMFLERNLEQLTRVHQQLVNQNNELRLEKKVSEKKLAARNERIHGLEVLLTSAQEKLQQQAEAHNNAIAKYKQLVEELKTKLDQANAKRQRASSFTTAAGGARIARPIRGGGGRKNSTLANVPPPVIRRSGSTLTNGAPTPSTDNKKRTATAGSGSSSSNGSGDGGSPSASSSGSSNGSSGSGGWSSAGTGGVVGGIGAVGSPLTERKAFLASRGVTPKSGGAGDDDFVHSKLADFGDIDTPASPYKPPN
jgi:hypothetical protein